MPRTNHTHNSERSRARLISTPHTHEGAHLMSGSTIVGVKFSDTLAALLDHAQAAGFRIEPDLDGKQKPKPNSVVIYPADKEQRPIHATERSAKFNQAHYENLKRELYRAGLPPLPADAVAVRGDAMVGVAVANNAAEAVKGLPKGSRAVDLQAVLDQGDEAGDLIDQMRRDEKGVLFGAVCDGVAKAAGLGENEAFLVGTMNQNLMRWFHEFGQATLESVSAFALTEAEKMFRKDVDEALELASQHEATALRATKALEAAEAKEAKAREDCAAAIRRAKAAEEEAREAKAALAPLRAFLAKD